MNIVDVSSWEKDEKREASGTRAKFWLIDPESDQRFLFKIPRENTGEYWAEYIASRMGQALGFQVMDVKIAAYNGTIGTLATNFIEKKEELYEGGDLFFSVVDSFDRYKLENYNIQNILLLLKDFALDKQFISVPIFDAFIGNQDRHCDNWGIISGESGYKLTPLYDNGASLGANLLEEKMTKIINDERMLKGFCNRSYTLIGTDEKRKPKHLDVLTELYPSYLDEFEINLNKLKKFNGKMLNTILKSIPDGIMSNITKEWVIKLLNYRKEWLLDWYERR